jgi:hypothetical protein
VGIERRTDPRLAAWVWIRYEPALADAEVPVSRSLAVLWFTSVAFPSAGCMSVVNHAPLWCPDEAKRERVYGGVLLNVESAVDALGRSLSARPGDRGRC